MLCWLLQSMEGTYHFLKDSVQKVSGKICWFYMNNFNFFAIWNDISNLCCSCCCRWVRAVDEFFTTLRSTRLSQRKKEVNYNNICSFLYYLLHNIISTKLHFLN